MTQDVFISYSSHDKAVADAICLEIEARGIHCWIAPRNVLPGMLYGEALVNAIHAARMMVLVLSVYSNSSPQVIREVERAGSQGIPIIPFRIDDVQLSKAMEFFVSTHHWLDANSPPIEKHIGRLADAVESLGRKPDEAQEKWSTAESNRRTPTQLSTPQAEIITHNLSSNLFANWRRDIDQGHLELSLDTRHESEVTSLAKILCEAMIGLGFSQRDGENAAIALTELLNNVYMHAGKIDAIANVRISFEQESYRGIKVNIQVADSGPGFELKTVLLTEERLLGKGDREHGLLRCFRLGDSLEQDQSGGHTLTWTSTNTAEQLPSIFDMTKAVAPVVFRFGTDLLRIGGEVITYRGFTKLELMEPEERVFFEINFMEMDLNNMDLNEIALNGHLKSFKISEVMKIAFDPLRRWPGRCIGFEVGGRHPTIVGNPLYTLPYLLMDYRNHVQPNLDMIIYADAMPEDHGILRAFSTRHGFPFFESEEACKLHFTSLYG